MPEQLASNLDRSDTHGDRDRLKRMFEHAPGFMALLEGSDHRFAMANPAFSELFGRTDLIGRTLREALPDLRGQEFTELLDRVAQSGKPATARALPLRISRIDVPAEEMFVDVLFQPLPDGSGERSAIFIQGHNVSEDKRSEALRVAHTRVLELAIGESPLEQTLSELIRIVESTSRTGVLGTILLLDEDGRHLRHGAAPSIPKAYTAAIDGAEIGPCAGSCGTAAYTATPVFVSDIETDPLWANYKQVALPHGLRSCWSIPIMTPGRRVLGTFAMYHREPREPTVRDLALVDLVTQTAALVIDRHRGHAALIKISAISGRAANA